MMSIMTLTASARKDLVTTVVSADTIFYNNDNRTVLNRDDASYYRLLAQEGTGINKRDVFQDFYLSGQLKTQAGYKFIDLGNDKNTVLDGQVTTYYQNGKEKWRCNYLNGKRNGYFTMMMRDGSIGTIEYANGVSKHGYMIVTHTDGSIEKRPLSTVEHLIQ